LAGHNTGSLQNTFNTGKITGTGEAGGIAGHNEGTMAYGYNSGEVSGSAAVGAIAGSSSQTLGKYYYVNTMAADESQPNLVAMDAEAMRTQTFCDMLNADIGGQDFRSWTYSTSQNKGYPRIKRTVNTMTTLTDPLTGIRVSGCFHPDSQLVIKKVEPGDEAYQALSSANTSGSQIQKAYKINVLSNDGTEAPYEGKIQITFPADLLTNLNNMQIAHLKDGRFDSSKADISLGKATVQVDELGTFGLAQTTDEEGGESVNTGNNNEKTTANTQTNTQDNVNTGLLGKMSPIIFIVLGLAVCGCGYEITVRRKQRNGHEKK
ncbi:MAG: hypothetical protein PHN26_05565, partial [Eubacteriaceae bacterium]|nr:hypothetical protein [Eubacteriaceae bacterium]